MVSHNITKRDRSANIVLIILKRLCYRLTNCFQSKACGKEIPYEIKPRRAGDIATCYCDASKAKEELHWVAERGLDEMCEDSWRWQSQNPNGYEG